MTDPSYRAVARRFLDKYMREIGSAPVKWPEGEVGGKSTASMETDEADAEPVLAAHP